METITVATSEEVAEVEVAGTGVKCCFVHRYRLLLLLEENLRASLFSLAEGK
jgi:hypothetical protein